MEISPHLYQSRNSVHAAIEQAVAELVDGFTIDEVRSIIAAAACDSLACRAGHPAEPILFPFELEQGR